MEQTTAKKNKYEIDMCNGTIMDKLISFSLPLMLSGILQLMFNAVDIIVVGRFSGSQALAAVGSTSALINVFTNLFIGISLGANVLTARFYAAGREKEVSETVHTAITLALVSGIVMALVGLVFSKGALALMGTPDDVIGLSALYMRIYFLGMPFFMLYNYGAAILRAVGDTKRPLLFLMIAGVINACLNMVLVIVFKLGVAGVAIATVISQMISCVLVLRCLCRSESSYRLRFSELGMKGYYLKQIFSVGVPAGIQSTVINFSNVLLQSSVNSFGSTAMAGYTAANNLLGFLYVSVNSITQACMSCSFGMHLLWVRTGNFTDLHGGCRGNCVRYGDPCIHDDHLFSLRLDGFVPGGAARHGIFRGADGVVGHRNGWYESGVDFWHFSIPQITGDSVYILSSVVDYHDCPAGNLFLLCETESAPEKSDACRAGRLSLELAGIPAESGRKHAGDLPDRGKSPIPGIQ